MVDGELLRGYCLADLVEDQPEPYKSALMHGMLYFKFFNDQYQKIPVLKLVS